MAYSLSDYFRYLRLIFRINGLVNGLLFGLCLLILPRLVTDLLGTTTQPGSWSLRLAGAHMIALGILLLNQANERTIPPIVSLVSIVSHALAALVLLLAYLQREVAPASLTGQIFLTVIFVLHLLGAVVPIRFMRADYRRM